MPLRMKCRECGRELLLDEAFSGVYCRCQHCRSLIQVPRLPGHVAKRPAARPARPPLAGERQASHGAVPAEASNRPGARAQRLLDRIPDRLRSPVVLAPIILLVTIGIAIMAWRVSGAPPSQPLDQLTLADSGVASNPKTEPAATDDPVLRLASADPLKTYFGFPLTGKTIGFVVDADITMAPYIDRLASVTNPVNEAVEPGTRRIGIIMATGQEGHTILEVVEPSTDLLGARAVLTARLPTGRTDLSKALSRTANWYADTIFLILAKRVDDKQLAILRENAEQTGAVVNVIALGEAAEQDLSPISKATGGGFLPVRGNMLNDLVTRVRQRQQDRPDDDETP